MTMRSRGAGLAVGVPLLLAVVLAGCAKHPKTNGVASVGGPASTAATPSAGPSMSMQERALKFGQCMRDHGIPMDDPEVDDQGHVNVKIGGPGSAPVDQAKMEAAQKACQQYAPFGDPGTDHPDPSAEANARQMAQCMRDNGVENFPDPDGGRITIDGSIADDPDFQKAQEKCGHLMPARGGVTK
jgi:hypothetical protein